MSARRNPLVELTAAERTLLCEVLDALRTHYSAHPRVARWVEAAMAQLVQEGRRQRALVDGLLAELHRPDVLRRDDR